MKLAQASVKYLIEAEFSVKGAVEKHDVIGAIFGQTEGLIGPDLDLKELQRTGRIGRIEVEVSSESERSTGIIRIPSSLSSSETAMLAASLETIERIGPYEAEVKVLRVKDVREEKRKWIAERAKNILRELVQQENQLSEELVEKVQEELRLERVQSWQGLDCGPTVLQADEMILVEGRADVLNLLRCGIANVISTNGVEIPEALKQLAQQKITTLFVDGDRAGKMLAMKALQLLEIDYIAFAPEGKEVEELSTKEVLKALRNRVSAEQWKIRQEEAQLSGAPDRSAPWE